MECLILINSNAFSENIYIFAFLVNLQTPKYVTSAFTFEVTLSIVSLEA